MSNFHQLIWNLYIFFDDLVVQFSCPFKNTVVFLSLSFENSILNTSSSSDIWLASIFKVQKLLNFGKVSYQLLLWSMLLVLYLRNLYLTQIGTRSQRFPPDFFLKVLVLGFVIHSEFFYMFILPAYGYPSSAPFL